MDFEFHKVEDLGYCIDNSECKHDKRVFKSMDLNKDKYKLTIINKIKEDIFNFLSKRLFECFNSHLDRSEYVEFTLKVDFFDRNDKHVEFHLMTYKHFPNGDSTLSGEKIFFKERFFSKMKERGYYRCCFYIYEIVKYPTPQNVETEEIPIIKTFKEDKCVICLENEPNILYEHCGHMPTYLKCEEIKNLSKCPICRSIASLKSFKYTEFCFPEMS